MILEVARLSIKPGMEAEFEQGVRLATSLFQRAPGCLAMEVRRVLESPLHYHLQVHWATLEAHTVHFRTSVEFQSWRGLVGHCFAAPPEVVHTTVAVHGF